MQTQKKKEDWRLDEGSTHTFSSHILYTEADFYKEGGASAVQAPMCSVFTYTVCGWMEDRAKYST